MAARGVKEINLIAQDTTMYGRDLAGNGYLEDLLERLLSIRELYWIRIMYSHPSCISDRLLELMEKEDAICPYLDLPIQHVNKDILKCMGRALNRESPSQLIERVRSINRRISLRTTLMVGFPGETEDAFRELYNFVEMAEFDHLGSFIYSPERGTAAEKLNGAPDREVAEERLDAIMRLQAEISGRKNRQMIGQIIPVLIEGTSLETDLLLRGRTSGMAPDVDGQVLINKGRGMVGEITPVLIKEAYTYDLVGEIIFTDN
jgi:ribosomal protein S12 methylthiotransferase